MFFFSFLATLHEASSLSIRVFLFMIEGSKNLLWIQLCHHAPNLGRNYSNYSPKDTLACPENLKVKVVFLQSISTHYLYLCTTITCPISDNCLTFLNSQTPKAIYTHAFSLENTLLAWLNCISPMHLYLFYIFIGKQIQRLPSILEKIPLPRRYPIHS